MRMAASSDSIGVLSQESLDQRFGLGGVTGLEFQGAIGPGDGDADLGRGTAVLQPGGEGTGQDSGDTTGTEGYREQIEPGTELVLRGCGGQDVHAPLKASFTAEPPDQRQAIVKFSRRVEPDLNIRRPGVLGAVHLVLPRLLPASDAQDSPGLVREVTLRWQARPVRTRPNEAMSRHDTGPTRSPRSGYADWAAAVGLTAYFVSCPACTRAQWITLRRPWRCRACLGLLEKEHAYRPVDRFVRFVETSVGRGLFAMPDLGGPFTDEELGLTGGTEDDLL